MADKAKTYRPPLVLKVLSSEIQVMKSESVTWLGRVFPSHFQISLMLEDQTSNSSLNWVATFEFVFKEGEPFFKSVTCTGLGHQNSYFSPSVETTPNSQSVVLFNAPLDTRERSEVEQVQRWQLNYVQENLFQLKRACFELVATNTTLGENGFVFTVSSAWSSDYPNGRGLEDFSKAFNTWQTRTVLTPARLREVAEIYQNEVLKAEVTGRRAKPAHVIAYEYGKPLATANRWIAKAREEGLLPPSEKGKATSKFSVNTNKGESNDN